MEDVMYGVMLRAKMDMDENEPPVMALKKPNTSVVCFANQFGKERCLDSRNRQLAAKTDDYQHHKGIENLSAKLFLP